MNKHPLVSVIMPSFNHEPFVEAAIRSVVEQTYPNVELVIRDDGSTDRTPEIIEAWVQRHPEKIRYLGSGKNIGVSRSWNQILKKIKGEFVVPFASDDLLYPDTIEKRVAFMLSRPDLDIITSDFDVITDNDQIIRGTDKLNLVPQFTRFFQVDRTHLYPELLRGNFVPSITVMIRLKRLSKSQIYHDGACPNLSDFDLWLRLSRGYKWGYLEAVTAAYRWHQDNFSSPDNRRNDPQVLYPQLIKIFSAQLVVPQTPEQRLQTLAAINDLSKRLYEHTQTRLQAPEKKAATAARKSSPVFSENPRVSVIIPVFNKLEFTRQCLETIYLQNREDTPFEVIVVDNASSDGTEAYLKEALNRFPRLTIVTNVENTGFAAACNLGASKANGEYLLFLNNDTEPRPGWLDTLVATLDQDVAVAAVGSKLLFPDGTIQHAGVVLVDDRRIGDPLNASHHHYRAHGDRPEVNVPMEYPALTAACLMVRKLAFHLVGEFDEGYWNGYEDVDFCLKLRQRGWKLVYQPRSVLIHYESQSDRRERFGRVAENVRRLHERWGGVARPQFIMQADGVFHPTADNTLCPYHKPQQPRAAPPVPAVPSTGKDAPLVSIIILTFNQLDKTRECLESIAKYTRVPHEIIVVDNASRDGTRKFLKKWVTAAKHHRVILNMQNKGFAAGNNQGIREARGEYVVLLNNDTVVTEGWLSGLIRACQTGERVALVGPKSNYVAGHQLERHIPYRDERQLQAFAREYHRLFAGRSRKVHRLVGFCLLIKKALLNEIGLLDERFGLGNYEDDDLSLRAALAGYKLCIAEDVFIHHYGNSSFTANDIDYLVSLEKNRKIFLDKWQDLDQPQPLLIDILLEEAGWQAQNNHPGAAEKVLQHAFALAPGHKAVAEAYEKFLVRQQRITEAAEMLQHYVQHNPDDHEAFNALGMHYWRLQHIAPAIDAFQKAVERVPDHLDYLKNLADANLAEERFEAAVELYVHLVRNYPADLEAYQKLANLYLEDNNPRSAYELLKHAQQYHPKNEQLNQWVQTLARVISHAESPGLAEG